ncbi:MAG: nucleotidyl transferase [Fibrobacter sp.]|nr:nucleotidyl transferase [Fibrobacter sp.]
MEQLNVLILAAGLGTRLRPLTSDVPKPLVPVVDKSILEQQAIKARAIVLDSGKDCAGVRLHANAHYLADQVVAEGARLGFEKVWVEYPEILGTAGPLKRIYNEGYRGGLLIMNGDAYCSFDLKKFVENAKKQMAAGGECAPGVALLAVDFPKVNTFRVDGEGRLVGVAGRFGSEVGAAATFSGVSYYSDEALARIADGEFDIREFWKQEIAAGRPPFVDMSQMDATWIDMGSPEGLWNATEARLAELGVDSWQDDRLIVSGKNRSIVFAGADLAEGEVVKNEIRGPGFVWKI